MFEKLGDVEKKFDELTTKLSDPKIIQDSRLFQKTSKEQASLRELVETYQEYKKTSSELEGNKQLLSEKEDEMKQLAKEEISRLEPEIENLEAKLKILLLPTDPNDDRNTILEIRAGTGGDEAALFASDLYRMYSKFAEVKKWNVEVMDSNTTGIGGIKEIVLLITGKKVYSDLKYESGVHRVQRVPQTETQGRVHTSAVSVVVIPEAEDVDIDVNPADLQIDVFRASGPGGQGVNTTDSAVRITHKPSGQIVVCRDERSQIKNKAKAMKILKSRLLEAEQTKQAEEEASTRKTMVGSGDRSEKIRTYNFPQNRMTDHRIGFTAHQLDQVIDGDLEDTIQHLRSYYQAEALNASQE